jgi:septum site-determining protein MinD
MKKIIVITSGKGGVGKTTTAINLGAAINYFGKDVIVIDANLTTPNIGVHLNSPELPVTLNHILLKKVKPFEAVYEHPSGLKIMPSSISIKELKKVKIEKLRDFKEDFQELGEYVVVDSAAGLGNEAISAIELADEIIVVTNPELPALTDALKTIKIADEFGKSIKGIIVTRVRKNKSESNPGFVKEMLEAPVLGMIPEDISVQESIKLKDALIHTHPKSKAARAYKEIAAKIINVDYDSSKDAPYFWEKIFRRRGY